MTKQEKSPRNLIQNKCKVSRSQMWQILRDEMSCQNTLGSGISETPLRVLDDKYLILYTLGDGRYAR